MQCLDLAVRHWIHFETGDENVDVRRDITINSLLLVAVAILLDKRLR